MRGPATVIAVAAMVLMTAGLRWWAQPDGRGGRPVGRTRAPAPPRAVLASADSKWWPDGRGRNHGSA